MSKTRVTRPLSFSVLALVLAWCGPSGALPADTLPETVRMGPSATSFMAGFIRPGLPVLGAVAPVGGFQSTAASRRMYTIGDILYLRMARPGDASPGDFFTLYRQVTNVYHPRTGHHLGDLAAPAVDDLFRRAGRCHDAGQRIALEVGNAGLAVGRHLGQRR